MRGPIWIAHKKIRSKIEKKLKVDAAKVKRETSKASKQNSGAPKRPSCGFLVFMKLYNEKFPDNKSVAAVGKAGGEKWKCMPESGVKDVQ